MSTYLKIRIRKADHEVEIELPKTTYENINRDGEAIAWVQKAISSTYEQMIKAEKEGLGAG
jgi:hypothetical protein